MYAFQYKHGDRPLEGYTIQRAAGRGGFGEVYYAISDSGREVALKAVTGYEQIELRGISQCMNLKSPHLVTIFDVRHNAQGRPFVIMEYVSGPSLRQLLDEHPAGLGQQKAAFFLREIAKGLTFLHECGIVHRDLKPGNIFYENGYVKIGDYGLSKAMTASQHSGQTVTVGTVHYMAPEIGAGKYDRGIDIYALGAVLYETLTGVPPFVGASPSEVLLKHLSAAPDCSNISEPFATVVQRAMAKDPGQRYASAQEMVEAVFGAEHVRQSMSVFSPEELSVVAGRAARQAVNTTAEVRAAAPGAAAVAPPPLPSEDPWQRMAQRMSRKFERVGEKLDCMGHKLDRAGDHMRCRLGWMAATPPAPDPSRDFSIPIEDPLPLGSRKMLAIVTIAIVAVATGALAPRSDGDPLLVGAFVAAGIGGALLGLTILRRRLLPNLDKESRGVQKLLTGGMAALGMLILTAGVSAADSRFHVKGTWLAMVVPMLLLDVNSWLDPRRSQRVGLGGAIAGGLLAFVLAGVFHGSPHIAIAVVAGTALAVQAVVPWDSRRAGIRPAFLLVTGSGNDAGGTAPPTNGAPAIAAPNPPGQAPRAGGAAQFVGWPVALAIRFIWMGVFALTISLAIAFFVAAGTARYHSDIPPFLCAGIGFALASVLSLVRAFSRVYYGVWNYLLRPLLMIACVIAGSGSAIIMGFENLRPEELAAATFFIVFPAILLLVLMFIPGKRYQTVRPAMPPSMPAGARGVSPYKRIWALLMAAIWFAGVGGLQRFYVGKVGTGILWFLTGGLFGIGQIVDVIMILTGSFTDKQGRRLVIWEDPSEIRTGEAALGNVPAPAPNPALQTAELNATPGDLPLVSPAPGSAAPATSSLAGSNSLSGSMVSPPQANALGLLSALAGLLIFLGTLLGIALAVDLPGAIAAGVFDPKLAESIRDNVFNGYHNWPLLVGRLDVMLISLILFIAVVVMLFARRRGGVLHMLRGVVGTGGVVASILMLAASFNRWQAWEQIAPLTASRQFAAAMDSFLNHWDARGVVMTGAVFLAAVVLFAWPGAPMRQRKLAQTA